VCGGRRLCPQCETHAAEVVASRGKLGARVVREDEVGGLKPGACPGCRLFFACREGVAADAAQRRDLDDGAAPIEEVRVPEGSLLQGTPWQGSGPILFLIRQPQKKPPMTNASGRSIVWPDWDGLVVVCHASPSEAEPALRRVTRRTALTPQLAGPEPRGRCDRVAAASIESLSCAHGVCALNPLSKVFEPSACGGKQGEVSPLIYERRDWRSTGIPGTGPSRSLNCRGSSSWLAKQLYVGPKGTITVHQSSSVDVGQDHAFFAGPTDLVDSIEQQQGRDRALKFRKCTARLVSAPLATYAQVLPRLACALSEAAGVSAEPAWSGAALRSLEQCHEAPRFELVRYEAAAVTAHAAHNDCKETCCAFAGEHQVPSALLAVPLDTRGKGSAAFTAGRFIDSATNIGLQPQLGVAEGKLRARVVLADVGQDQHETLPTRWGWVALVGTGFEQRVVEMVRARRAAGLSD
jgi:hypothetical protein